MNTDDFMSLLRDPLRAGSLAVQGASGSLDYPGLMERVDACAGRLAAQGARVFASVLDNGADWIVHDLACLQGRVVHVPLPLFFTPAQWCGAIEAAGVNVVAGLASMLPMLRPAGFELVDVSPGMPALFRRPDPDLPLPAGTSKITFTSGSTGAPKGVCLGAREMLAVARGLASVTSPLGIRRHFTALPLAVLLENIAGMYAPLMEGATMVTHPLAETGLQGSSRFDPGKFSAALSGSQAQSAIVLPQMLRAYSSWLRATGGHAPDSLRLMAVGGAAVGNELLADARALGLPVYEGYGLSEGCSVQTLNLPGADCPGSAGRPLPHARLRIAADGEIEIAGSLALGYLGQQPARERWLPTGDLGSVDDRGFLHVQGRKKNLLITGFGRNVSPEWIELRLASQPAIAHTVVLGEGQGELGAVIWPQPGASEAAIRAAIDQANRALPDYARIGPWMRARADFTVTSGLATANGRPRRAAVAAMHADLFPRNCAQPTP
ncbi:AMP-binding protein [Achromobacter spanius]|uniref:AMP-binding protein n=1 Tax=Achromobacter spanius TaxID=217203 RepID=UPI00320A0ABF